MKEELEYGFTTMFAVLSTSSSLHNFISSCNVSISWWYWWPVVETTSRMNLVKGKQSTSWSCCGVVVTDLRKQLISYELYVNWWITRRPKDKTRKLEKNIQWVLYFFFCLFLFYMYILTHLNNWFRIPFPAILSLTTHYAIFVCFFSFWGKLFYH